VEWLARWTCTADRSESVNGPYAPAGSVWTVAPAGGANVDAGGFAVYDCSVTVLPFAFTYVRTPFDVEPQYVTGVGSDVPSAVTQLEASPP
jgi:hypothetical protein